jgi:hypothetical protein
METNEREATNMACPAADFILDTVRQLNETIRRARSGEPTVDDYLRALESDPVTKWFTDLLREKGEELEKERQRADRLAFALRKWHDDSRTRLSNGQASNADLELYNVLRRLGVIEP